MKREVAKRVIACMAAFGGIGGSSAFADDRDLQAILVKQGCIAGSIRQADLSTSISVHEVTCRVSGRVLTIVCIDADCRLQPKPRQIEEGPDVNGAGP